MKKHYEEVKRDLPRRAYESEWHPVQCCKCESNAMFRAIWKDGELLYCSDHLQEMLENVHHNGLKEPRVKHVTAPD